MGDSDLGRALSESLAIYFFPEYDSLAARGLRIETGLRDYRGDAFEGSEYFGGMSDAERTWVKQHDAIITESPQTRATSFFRFLRDMYRALPKPLRIAVIIVLVIVCFTVLPKLLWLMMQGAGNSNTQLLFLFTILLLVFWVRFVPYEYEWG
jgi:hypothetical protein